ncbi:MAG: HAMP domain-containing histidine kinase [Bacteroidales bacterium]|jgi:signal transduction histidine kinase|nr:HAMP domain-containing histidine kinase [Bacteroidales bacterium]
MNKKFHLGLSWLLQLTVVLTALGFGLQKMFLYQDEDKNIKQKFEKVFQKKYELMEQRLEEMYEVIESSDFLSDFPTSFHHLFQLFEQQHIGFLIHDGQKLSYWSDNRFAFPKEEVLRIADGQVVLLPNGYYYCSLRRSGQYTIIGLILLKNDYPIRNDYLKNAFPEEYRIPDNTDIADADSDIGIVIRRPDGRNVVSLVPAEQSVFRPERAWVFTVPFILAFILLLEFLRRLLEFMMQGQRFAVRMLTLAALLGLLYAILLQTGLPDVFSAFRLFNPALYAESTVLPSLGHLLILTGLILFWCVCVANRMPLYHDAVGRHYSISQSWFILFNIITAGLYFLVNRLIAGLIYNSSASFYLNRFDDLGFGSIVGYFIIAMLFFSLSIVHVRLLSVNMPSRFLRNYERVMGIMLSVSAVLCVIFRTGYCYTFCFFCTMSLSDVLQNKLQRKLLIKRTSLLFLSYYVLVTTFFSLLIVQSYNHIRTRESQQLMAHSLYSEIDPVAEIALADVQYAMMRDTMLAVKMSPPYTELIDYLKQQYFSNYLKKFELQITVCASCDSLSAPEDAYYGSCFRYFERMIAREGRRIQDADSVSFYYMQRMNGRITYLGDIRIDSVIIYPELQTPLLPEGVGFPDLMSDHSKISRYKNLAYAEYCNEDLLFERGDCQYAPNIQYYIQDIDITGSVFVRKNDFEHLIYRAGDDNYIVVSSHCFTLSDYLTSFPYMFVFYLCLMYGLALATNHEYRKQLWTFNYGLKLKIQAIIIGLISISLILVVFVAIMYNLVRFRQQNDDRLTDKLESVAESIRLRLEYEQDMTPDIINWLRSELINLSNVFRTDISIYGANGVMLVSSRPDIVTLGITSNRMNAQAHFELVENLQPRFMQKEKIGNLAYTSVYQTINNLRGDCLGIINLPYFSQRSDLLQEINYFIMTFINLCLFLFIVIGVMGVAVSEKITQPLSLIREKLRTIQLRGMNEEISYSGRDEIGGLVQEYNRKVKELSESADQLARDEHDKAWIVLARQIAHDIKNPLTPMKLNIQQLQRLKKNNAADFDETFDRVAPAILEQIDDLSKSVGKFSEVALITSDKIEPVNLSDTIGQVITLFGQTPGIELIAENNDLTEVFINADKSQIKRALINLVKNAIEAIPADRHGIIRIALAADGQRAVLSVSDNGTGIHEEAKPNLFKPDFTTKTAGTGLGLFNVRKIAETFHGNISYRSEQGKGTTFTMDFPRINMPE